MEILGRKFEQVQIKIGNESFNQVISCRYSKLDYFILVSLVEIETNKKFEAIVTYNNDLLDSCYVGLFEVTEFNYELCERPINDEPNFFTYILMDDYTKITIEQFTEI